MGTKPHDTADYHVAGVAERLAAYDVTFVELPADDELVERAATLVQVMPPLQHRTTIEQLVSPNDPPRARRAVDALIASAFAAEDETGRLRRIG